MAETCSPMADYRPLSPLQILPPHPFRRHDLHLLSPFHVPYSFPNTSITTPYALHWYPRIQGHVRRRSSTSEPTDRRQFVALEPRALLGVWRRTVPTQCHHQSHSGTMFAVEGALVTRVHSEAQNSPPNGSVYMLW